MFSFLRFFLCFVLFRFFSVLFEFYSAWLFFFLVVLLVLFYFCFVLFCLICLGFWFFVCFFFSTVTVVFLHRHHADWNNLQPCQLDLLWNLWNIGSLSGWMNENCSRRELFEFEFLCSPPMNFTKVKISLWPIVALPLISELNESDWRACRSDNQGRETNLNCKCYVPIHYSYLLPVLHVEGFWKLQAINRGVLFSFTGVKKHLSFGVILFEVVSFEDDRRRLFLRDCWMDLFGFDVEEWWMSLCHEFSSR